MGENVIGSGSDVRAAHAPMEGGEHDCRAPLSAHDSGRTFSNTLEKIIPKGTLVLKVFVVLLREFYESDIFKPKKTYNF